MTSVRIGKKIWGKIQFDIQLHPIIGKHVTPYVEDSILDVQHVKIKENYKDTIKYLTLTKLYRNNGTK